MTDFDPLAWPFLDRYLAGQLTDAEREALDAWRATATDLAAVALLDRIDRTVQLPAHVGVEDSREGRAQAFVARVADARLAMERLSSIRRPLGAHVPSRMVRERGLFNVALTRGG